MAKEFNLANRNVGSVDKGNIYVIGDLKKLLKNNKGININLYQLKCVLSIYKPSIVSSKHPPFLLVIKKNVVLDNKSRRDMAK